MVTSFDISQEIFSIDVLRALKSSLKHRRKHVLRPLQLYGDQALKIGQPPVGDHLNILVWDRSAISRGSLF